MFLAGYHYRLGGLAVLLTAAGLTACAAGPPVAGPSVPDPALDGASPRTSTHNPNDYARGTDNTSALTVDRPPTPTEATSSVSVAPTPPPLPWRATTTSDTKAPAVPTPPCPNGAGARDAIGVPPPAGALDPAVQGALDSLRNAGGRVSAAVSVIGQGDLIEIDRDTALVPASNQKLLIAAAALEAMGPDAILTTMVVATGATVDGVVTGDVILVGGGDPTLSRGSGVANSLDALAVQMRARGITRVNGRVLVDDSRYDAERMAPGWAPSVWQSNIGPLSALIVDRNRGVADPTFFTDPALTHGATFREVLMASGITVEGSTTVEHRAGAAGEQLASVASPPLRDLLALLLGRSDNLVAESLVKELGVRRGKRGNTADGLREARSIANGLCVRLEGVDSDGSGLSESDRRTTGGLQRLLEVATTRGWWPAFRDALAVAGRSGTMASRLGGGATAGRVRAKTGSIGVARSLSGYISTARGRDVVFSIILNGGTTASEPTVDALITALATTL